MSTAAKVVPFPAPEDGAPKKSPVHTWDKLGPFRRKLLASPLKPNEKVVGMAILERIGLNANAYPSIARIAADTNVTERTVERSVKELVERGWLTKVSGRAGGRNTSNRYAPNYNRLRDTDPTDGDFIPTALTGLDDDQSRFTPTAVTSHPVTAVGLIPTGLSVLSRQPCRTNDKLNGSENEHIEKQREARATRPTQDLGVRDGSSRKARPKDPSKSRPTSLDSFELTGEHYRFGEDRGLSPATVEKSYGKWLEHRSGSKSRDWNADFLNWLARENLDKDDDYIWLNPGMHGAIKVPRNDPRAKAQAAREKKQAEERRAFYALSPDEQKRRKRAEDVRYGRNAQYPDGTCARDYDEDGNLKVVVSR